VAQITLSETESNVSINALAKNSILILTLKTGEIILAYIVQFFFAQWMGREEYGIYQYVISLSLVLAIPVSFGLPRTVLRLLSEYRIHQEWGELWGLLLSSWQFTVGIGLLFGIGATEAIYLINQHHNFIYASVLLVGVWLVPLQALIQLQEDMARGADDIPLAYTPSKILWPILLLGGGFFLFHQNQELTSIPVIQVSLITLIIVAVFQVSCLWSKFTQQLGIIEPVYKPRQWLIAALPLLLDRSFLILLTQTDIIMVGYFIGPEAVSNYTVASKTALWTSSVLQTLNLAVAPAFAILYKKGHLEDLQKVISEVMVWICVPSVTIAIITVIFAKPILSSFGPDFLTAHWTLKVLVLGETISVLLGPVGTLMTMTGHQNNSVVVSGFCTLANLGLNAILIPQYSGLGAAISTALTLIIWNIWLCILVLRKVNVNPSVFGILKKWDYKKL
jgi:O-antigen/teichoic acid export membrane protein